MNKAKYIMDAPGEVARLEEQSKLPGYRFADELRDWNLPRGAKVLDAGCGSGAGARYLTEAFPGISVEACDGSALRLKQARDLGTQQSHSKIRFFESRLEEINAEKGSYDAVLCRFVFEHLKTHQPVADEFFRVIRPGGIARVIDFDGILYNFFHGNEKLQKMMNEIQPKLELDLHVGRKIPRLLENAGFKDIQWRVEVLSFKGKYLEAEQSIMEQRIALALPVFVSILGSEARAMEFKQLYCDEMMNPASTLFYNKFTVDARKLS